MEVSAGIGMMFKALGIDPNEIQGQVKAFQTAFENINSSLVSIDGRLERVEAQNAEILKELEGARLSVVD